MTERREQIRTVAATLHPFLLGDKLDKVADTWGISRSAACKRVSRNSEVTPVTLAEMLMGYKAGVIPLEALQKIFSEVGLIVTDPRAPVCLMSTLRSVSNFALIGTEAAEDGIIDHLEQGPVRDAAFDAAAKLTGLGLACRPSDGRPIPVFNK